MVCSICGATGHNCRTCPTLTTPQRPQRMSQIPQRPQRPANPNPSLTLNQNTINSIISQLTLIPNSPILSAIISPQTNRNSQNSSNLHMPPSSHLIRMVHPVFTNSIGKDINVYRITDENKLKFVTIVYSNNTVSHYVNYTVGWELIGTDVTLDENIDYDWIIQNMASQILFAKTFVNHNQSIHIEEIDVSKEWKNNAIKMKYLLDQMVNLGANDEKVYPNLAPIMDLVQDIVLPDYDQLDRENAGIPSTLTNTD